MERSPLVVRLAVNCSGVSNPPTWNEIRFQPVVRGTVCNVGVCPIALEHHQRNKEHDRANLNNLKLNLLIKPRMICWPRLAGIPSGFVDCLSLLHPEASE